MNRYRPLAFIPRVPPAFPLYPIVGAVPPPPPTTNEKPPVAEKIETFTVEGVKRSLASITPALILVGIATGAAFAIGSGLVSRYVWKDRR